MVEENHLNDSIEDNAQQEKRIEEIGFAVNHLLSINYLIIVTVLTVEILVIINIATHHIIPIWIIFSTLWLGHAILAIMAFYSIKQIFTSLESDKATPTRSDVDPRYTQRWHISNEKTIPLIQYLIYCLLCLLWISSNLLLVEILGYLSYLSLVPKFSIVIPIYILAGCSIVSAVLCRSTSLSLSVSWCLVLVTAVLLNVEIIYPSSISYTAVLIPSYALIGFWLVICAYIFICYFSGYHTLKDEQLRMSLLFLTSLFLFLIADIGLGKILTNSGDLLFGSKILVMSVFLSGSILFSVWLILYVQKSVRMTIKRMGAVRPKSLSRSEDGFWITSERFSSFSGVDMIIGDLAHYSTQLNETEMNSKDIKCGQIIVNFVLKCMKKISIICECGASQPQSEESHVSTHNMSLYGSTNKNSRNTPMEPLLNDFSE